MVTCTGVAMDEEWFAPPGLAAALGAAPSTEVHVPLRFDVIDLAAERSLGGCTCHVLHPGGRSSDAIPVNASEAESRRVSRFDEAEADLGARGAQSLAASYPRLTDSEALFTEHRDELAALAERLQTRLRLVADGLAEVFFSPPLAPRRMGSGFAVGPQNQVPGHEGATT